MIDEKTLFQGSSSPVINLGIFALCGVVFVAAVSAGFFVPAPLGWISLGAAAVALIYAAISWLFIRVRKYEITTERVRVTTGLVTRRTDDLELYRVKDVTLVESLPARIFGCGTIAITTNDASTPGLELAYLPGARDLREQLRQSIEACRDRKRVRVAELE